VRHTLVLAIVLLALLLPGCLGRADRSREAPGEQPPPPVYRTDSFMLSSPIPPRVAGKLLLSGRARVPGGRFQVVVEDGHDELARREVWATAAAPQWGEFRVELDLQPPTASGGTLYFVIVEPDGSLRRDLTIPITF
jgi:hypothetical protein